MSKDNASNEESRIESKEGIKKKPVASRPISGTGTIYVIYHTSTFILKSLTAENDSVKNLRQKYLQTLF